MTENFFEMIERKIEGMKEAHDSCLKFENEVIMKLDSDPVREKTKRVKRFCTEELAQILYECVECSEDPRDKVDWVTSENFLNEHFDESTWKRLTQRDICLRTYDLCRKIDSNLEEIHYKIIENFDDCFEEYIKILRKINCYDNVFLVEATKSDENMKLYIRRLLWEWGYQNLQRELKSPYGKINYY